MPPFTRMGHRVLAWTPPGPRNSERLPNCWGPKLISHYQCNNFLEIGWTQLKANSGGNPVWTTSSTSAGFGRRVHVLHIFCYVFTFHSLFTPVPNGACHFLAYRLDSARLHFIQPHCVQAIQQLDTTRA